MNKILMSIIAASAIFSNTSTIYANDIAVNNKIEEKEVTENEYLQNIDRFNKLNMKGVYSKFENKDTFVLYIGRKTCPHCRKFSSVLREFNTLYRNKLNYYDIESPDLDKDGKVFLSKLQIPGVPAVLYVKEGKIVNVWAGTGITAKGLYDRFFKEDAKSIEKNIVKDSNIRKEENNIIENNKDLVNTNSRTEKNIVKDSNIRKEENNIIENNKDLVNTNSRIEKIKNINYNTIINKVKTLPKTSSVR